MKEYIRLMRPHHWMKNVLVLLPLCFSGRLLQGELLLRGLLGFLAFSCLASGVYCINDLRDRERDRENPAKAHRPLAAGTVSVPGAMILCLVLLGLACGLTWGAGGGLGWLWLGLYLVLNLGYSFGLKNYPIIDIGILASGFLLRLLYGGAVLGIELSKWLCLTVIALSFFLGLGKRRGEKVTGNDNGRKVLQYYSQEFLGYNMYMCLALAVVFYAMWTVDALTVSRVGSERLVWTVPLVILCCMRYSQDVEGQTQADPVEVLLKDKLLLALGAILGVCVLGFIYL